MSSQNKRRSPKLGRTTQQTLCSGVKYGNPGVSRDLSTDQLTSGLPYQRPVKPRDVNRLVREWDSRKLQPIIVSFRDGKFNVVDGQHRIAAMRKIAGGRDVIVPCLIFSGLTYQDEAEMYAKLDRGKKRLNARQSVNALVESGTDANVLEVKRLVEESGFTWALAKQTGAAYEIGATRALINAHHLLGGEVFVRMLLLLDGTWHGTPASLRASMFSGLALFLKTYEAELDDRAFVRRLSGVEPEEVIRQSKEEDSASMRLAKALLDHYNQEARNGRTLPDRFKR